MNFAKNRRGGGASLKSLEDDDLSLTGSNGTYFDSDEDVEYKPSNKRLRSSDMYNGKRDGESASKIQRKPTRIPDSKVTNRNALLARENRKKKKEMMENLEQTCTELENENKRLLKMMKFKDAREKKLLKEIQYLKSVIYNRTEIVSVLKSLPQLAKPQPAAAKKATAAAVAAAAAAAGNQIGVKVEENSAGYASKASSITLSCDRYSSGSEDDLHLDVATDWDEILQNPFSSATDFADITKFDDMGILSPASSPPSSEISTEHNYSHLEEGPEEDEKLMEQEEDSPGVCIHVRRGKVSLEFCSAKKSRKKKKKKEQSIISSNNDS